MIHAQGWRRSSTVSQAGLSWCLAAAGALAAGLPGCAADNKGNIFGRRSAGPSRAPSLPTVTDRLRTTYPELSSGRFLVLADFEDPQQGQIFTMLTPGEGGYSHLSTRRSRRETGAGSLEVHFSSADDMLVAGDSPGADWPFPVDWRAHKLLLMSIYKLGDPGALTLEILGHRAEVGYRRAGVFLSPGWNTLRVDLAEVAQWVDLGHVGQIRWRPEAFAEPTTLFLDDLILTDNSAELLGSPEGPLGELYVVHEGQRIRVGSCGRFELVFANGQIVGWYDLHRDPARERNCVSWPSPRFVALGPTAVVLRTTNEAAGESGPLARPGESVKPLPDLDGDGGWSPFGRQIGLRQRILEATSLRVVVECERLIGRDLAAAATWPESVGTGPGQESPEPGYARIVTRYTLTPLGRGFIHLICPTAGDSWQAQELGVAFAGSLQGGFEPFCHSAPIQLREEGPAPTSFILLARGRDRPGSSDLLCVAHDPEALPDVVPLEDEEGERLGAMFLTSRLRRPRQDWALAMVVWPDDLDDEEAAELLAMDYSHPPVLHVEVGELVRTDVGDLNNDGFNEAEGCYVIKPAGNRLRMRLQVRERPCWYPMFKLAGTKGRRTWAYADGDILTAQARSADGSVLIALNRVVDRPVELEVVVQAASASPEEPGTKEAARAESTPG